MESFLLVYSIIDMCWNKDVSLNTFLFSGFVLLLIFYNNNYTQYKIPEFDNKWVYVFFLSFIFIQLLEYFIWVNINNPVLNYRFTMMAFILLLFQPIAAMLMIRNESFRKKLIYLYLLLAIPFSIVSLYGKKNIGSSRTQLGHLKWDLIFSNTYLNNIFYFIWLLFFLFPLFYENNFNGLMFGIITLLIVIYNYWTDYSTGSMWCWVVNSVMVYYAAYLLFYLPFFK